MTDRSENDMMQEIKGILRELERKVYGLETAFTAGIARLETRQSVTDMQIKQMVDAVANSASKAEIEAVRARQWILVASIFVPVLLGIVGVIGWYIR